MPAMALRAATAFALQLLLATAMKQEPVAQPPAAAPKPSAIQKVVKLIVEMKVQVEKEASEDQISFDKYKCWCVTNEKEKTEAIKNGEARIEDLTAFVEEAAAKEGQLKTEIAQLETDIAEDKDALAQATGIRNKENAEFQAASADMKETIAALTDAVGVLSKVQLLQKKGHNVDETQALLQIRNIVKPRLATFKGVMQKDLFDLLGSVQETERQALQGSFLFLPKRQAAALEQQVGQLLPWEKTDEQIGMEGKPNDLVGAAAGAKSYNSRSGSILGLLSEMRNQFGRDLIAAEKQEFEALKSFQTLRAAKLAEIVAATKQKKQKEEALADLLEKAAKAKEEIEDLTAAVAADQEFLANLQKNCKVVDEEYAGRVEVRTEEIRALAETLKILTADDARTLFDKTISFVQVDSTARMTVAMDRAAEHAMQRIMVAARKNHNWALATLAVSVRLDAFTKVKAAMDKMTAELKLQQKSEYEKWEFCKTAIDKTEDKIWEGNNEKKDLDEKHLDLENTIATLTDTIDKLKIEVADMEVSLKQAGEQRKEENQLFQSSVADQRATINILNKALARLKEFYAEKPSLLQAGRQEPGAAAPPPPPKPQAYEKSASAGGVVQLITMVIEDAGRVEQALSQDEQKSQEAYGTYVKDTAASIEADRNAIANNEEMLAETEGEKSQTAEAQLANDAELAKQGELLQAHHAECDFVLKYFDMRQKGRQEEMDSIDEAKAILSGANFGA